MSLRFASLPPLGGWARPLGPPGWSSRRSGARRGCAGRSRTLRRYPGGAVVSVRLRDRTYVEVVDDMIDGVLVANRVERGVGPAPAPRVPARAAARAEIDLTTEETASAQAEPPTLAAQARVAERQTQAA